MSCLMPCKTKALYGDKLGTIRPKMAQIEPIANICSYVEHSGLCDHQKVQYKYVLSKVSILSTVFTFSHSP